MLVEPREKRNDFVAPACDVGGRFNGDAGRGIFDEDGAGAALDEVDVDAAGSFVVAVLPTVDDFINALSDACFILLESG